MVATPSMPAVSPAPVQQSQEETKEKTQKEILDAERKRQGRSETILTSDSGSMATTARKTLLGE